MVMNDFMSRVATGIMVIISTPFRDLKTPLTSSPSPMSSPVYRQDMALPHCTGTNPPAIKSIKLT